MTTTTDHAPSGLSIEYALYRLVLVLLACAAGGVLFGIVGIFHWALVIPSALLVTAWATTKVKPRTIPCGRLPLALLVIVIGVSVGMSVVQPAEHLLAGRDPATYLASSSWLAETGRFHVDARVGAFSDVEGLTFAVPGFYDERSDGLLSPEFFHAFPALLAIVGQIGGVSAMLGLNAMLGGIVLWAVFALAARLTGPWWALLGVSLVAGNQVFVYFTRGPFSEPLALLFVAAGAWLLVAADANDTNLKLVGGAVLGASVLVRVDALLLVIPLVALVVLGGSHGRWAVPVLRGFLWVAAFGIVEVLLVAPWYLGKFDSQFLLIGGAVAVLMALRAVPARVRARTLEWVQANRFSVATSAVSLGGVALIFAAIRPLLGAATGDPYDLASIQMAEGLAVEPDRTYAEYSLHWLSWYAGPVGLVAGLGGLGILVWRSIVGRARPGVTLWVGMTVMVVGAYLWRPSINPDHIWAMRRFLPVVIPGLAVGAAVALNSLARGAPWRSYLAGILAAAAVTGVAIGYADVWDLHELEGLNTDFTAACKTIGPDAAVLVVDTDETNPSTQLLQSFRSYCGVPTAAASAGIGEAEVAHLADRWASEDRRLVVVAVEDATLSALGVEPEARLLESPYPLLEYTLTRRPTDVTAISAAVWYGVAN